MPPLAQKIVRGVLACGSPERDAALMVGNLLDPETKMFEVSDIMDLAADLADQANWVGGSDPHVFLPSDCFWMEGKPTSPNSLRVAWFVTPEPSGKWMIWLARETPVPTFDGPILWTKDPDGNKSFLVSSEMAKRTSPENIKPLFAAARWMLALVSLANTPSFIKQTTVPAHTGLAKTVSQKLGKPKKDCLKQWSKVHLSITTSQEARDDGHDAVMSGTKAYHFCRSHIRIKMGRVEYVKAHWRGDITKGVLRSVHRVTG